MQYPFSCAPATQAGVEQTLSLPRLNRFLPAAGGDKNLALRLYIWNAGICEAFYLPMQFAEVAVRNAIHRALVSRYGGDWDTQGRFVCNLPDRLAHELIEVRTKEQGAKGSAFTPDHVVAGLSFGFWAHMLTKNFEHLLWKGGIQHAFTLAPKKIRRNEAHERVERLRTWRNRIAHHHAVFDKSPTSEFQNLMDVLGWIDPHAYWLMKELSNVTRVINQRPKL